MAGQTFSGNVTSWSMDLVVLFDFPFLLVLVRTHKVIWARPRSPSPSLESSVPHGSNGIATRQKPSGMAEVWWAFIEDIHLMAAGAVGRKSGGLNTNRWFVMSTP